MRAEWSALRWTSRVCPVSLASLRARLEQVPHDVRRNDDHRGVLQRDGPHVGGLMAVHSRLPAELAGMNRSDLAHLIDP